MLKPAKNQPSMSALKKKSHRSVIVWGLFALVVLLIGSMVGMTLLNKGANIGSKAAGGSDAACIRELKLISKAYYERVNNCNNAAGMSWDVNNCICRRTRHRVGTDRAR